MSRVTKTIRQQLDYRPKKGSFSQRGNEKRTHWLRSNIFRYNQYKAWAEGIITCRVSPSGTGRECASCNAQVTRYIEGQATSASTPDAPGALRRVWNARQRRS